MEVKITKEDFCDCLKEQVSGCVKRVEVIDEKHKHRFIFTQTEDNGVFVKIIPYNIPDEILKQED